MNTTFQSDFFSNFKHKTMINRLAKNKESLFWYLALILRKSLKGESLKNILWYQIHGNILLEPYKSIYFYIPKVACSSLKKVWADVLKLNVSSINIEDNIHDIDFPYVKRSKVTSYYNDYFKFCFVRNPWDRIVSCYKDKIDKNRQMKNPINALQRFFLKRNIGISDMYFDNFVEIISRIPDEEAEKHFMSQSCFILDNKKSLIVDYIGRFENLAHDFDFVASKLGINASIPHLRKASYGIYQSYYNQRTIDIVYERYYRDIKMFGYTFTNE